MLVSIIKVEMKGKICQWTELTYLGLRPNKKISVFQVTALIILGRVGTHFFFWKKYSSMHFERRNAFQNA